MTAIIVHGGAKEIPAEDSESYRDGCTQAVEIGWCILERGGSALEAVEASVRLLEDDPAFNAGFGSALNADGEVQMDASIMDGRTLNSGAVGFLQGVSHPISIARKVLDCDEVLLVGDGARKFAEQESCELCAPENLVSAHRFEEWIKGGGDPKNTVGCIALDSDGNIACGSSTGGTGRNRRGRLGDTPQIGCGFYANNEAGACAFTGDGEYIARLVLAKAAVDLLGTMEPDEVAKLVISDMASRIGGEAGCILIDASGRIGWWHNSKNMAVSYRTDFAARAHAFVSKEEEVVQTV